MPPPSANVTMTGSPNSTVIVLLVALVVELDGDPVRAALRADPVNGVVAEALAVDRAACAPSGIECTSSFAGLVLQLDDLLLDPLAIGRLG